MTLPIVGAQNLIMGITLLVLCLTKKYSRVQNKHGLWFFTAAMLCISLVNLGEYWDNPPPPKYSEYFSFAVQIFAASCQLVLFLFAYISMLDKNFVTLRRIGLEIVLVVLFTTPALFISIEEYPVLFNVVFGMGILFYFVKFSHNIYIYKKYIGRVTTEIENYSSDGSVSLLQWINNTFYVVLSVGVISVIIPLTNYTVLTVYNIFLFFAYLYIYIQIIRNIHLFDSTITAMKRHGTPHVRAAERHPDQAMESLPNDPIGFLNMRPEAFEKWMAHRYYAIPGITADEIASQFGTNRTKLSIYLRKELQTNFYEWIALMRIEDAKRQLIEYPDRPVYEIAVNVGIEDKSNFGRLFKRYIGVSPAVYRSEHGSETKQIA